MWIRFGSIFKHHLGFGLCLFLGALFLGGCQARTHLSPHYAKSYQYIFNAQIQNTRTLVSPISAKDAKSILEKRANRQSGSNGRQGRGRAFSKRSSNNVAASLGL
jgi:hypothetical protein